MDRTTTEQTGQPVTETSRPQRRPRAARTAANAVRQGILANIPVIPGEERRSELQAHLQGILASLHPVGHTEQILAELIAFQLWRLVRVARYEREAFDVGREGLIEYPDGEILQSPLPGRAVAICDVLERLQRYEAHLSRELYRAFRELRTLQALRRNTPAERPAALRAQLDTLLLADAPSARPGGATPMGPAPDVDSLLPPADTATAASATETTIAASAEATGEPAPVAPPVPVAEALDDPHPSPIAVVSAQPRTTAKNYETTCACTATQTVRKTGPIQPRKPAPRRRKRRP